jgi:hypothetical protein
MAKINELMELETYKEHEATVEKMGFSLFKKRAKIGNSKHIRVRPRFDEWSTSGEITILDPQITLDVLRQILEISGRLKGLGDWRPGGKTPGAFGMFTAKVS